MDPTHGSWRDGHGAEVEPMAAPLEEPESPLLLLLPPKDLGFFLPFLDFGVAPLEPEPLEGWH